MQPLKVLNNVSVLTSTTKITLTPHIVASFVVALVVASSPRINNVWVRVHNGAWRRIFLADKVVMVGDMYFLVLQALFIWVDCCIIDCEGD